MTISSDFDAALAFQANLKDDRKIIVTNVSSRVTQPQLQAFFTQFGKVSVCCSFPQSSFIPQRILKNYSTLCNSPLVIKELNIFQVSHCSLPREDGKKTSIFATMGRSQKTCGVATITFKSVESLSILNSLVFQYFFFKRLRVYEKFDLII